MTFLTGWTWFIQLMRRLPLWVVLPLFLVPELINQTMSACTLKLFMHGHIFKGCAVLFAIKVTAALWIGLLYAGAAPTLNRIRWVAWIHHATGNTVSWIWTRSGGAAVCEPLLTRICRKNASPTSLSAH